METCGQCGSHNIFSGSSVPSKCRSCGAIEGINEWYHEKEVEQMKISIEFTIDELLLIHQDQTDGLQNIHDEHFLCNDFSQCPPKHFGNEDIEDVFLRQSVLKKINTIKNEMKGE